VDSSEGIFAQDESVETEASQGQPQGRTGERRVPEFADPDTNEERGAREQGEIIGELVRSGRA
jgi:hypothetical protein